MARIFITGSSDGIGLAAAKKLIEQGHEVTLHARNAQRAAQTQAAAPDAAGILTGDLTSLESTRQLADAANAAGPWDAVVHNAGIGPSSQYCQTADGMAALFQVNSLAPYVLTALMERPSRLMYLSSSSHYSGDDGLQDVEWQTRKWSSFQAYSDSKLHNIMLANAVARYWPKQQIVALDPGWVKTKMGGSSAPGSTVAPADAIAAFAVGESKLIGDKSGIYLNPTTVRSPHQGALDTRNQDKFIKICERLSGGVVLAK